MTAFKFTIKDIGTKEELDKLARRTANLSPAMAQAAAYMERQTRLNFAKESDPDGAAWAGLAPSTLRRKRSGAILRESGELVKSISSSSSDKQARVFSPGPDYNIYHQQGTSRMPARVFIGIGEQHKEPVIRIVKNYLLK